MVAILDNGLRMYEHVYNQSEQRFHKIENGPFELRHITVNLFSHGPGKF